MAIKAYTGLMGAGKTYEVVTVVIKNALASGRRVVSNIAGLNHAEFVNILTEEGIEAVKIGELLQVSHSDVMKPEFWRTDTDAETGYETIIQPGDLVVLDEIWRFWNGFAPRDDEKNVRSPRVMNFFRMHRQMPHPVTGVTCDLAVICQDVMDAHRQLRGVIEETYVMTKLTAVGSDTRYRIEVFQKARITRRPLREPMFGTYNKKYFPLYQSHSQKDANGVNAREVNVDKRGNVLGGLFFKVVLPLMVPLLIGAVWFVWGFFHPKEIAKETAKEADKNTPVAQVKAGDSSSKKHNDASPPTHDEKYKVVGWYSVGGIQRVILTDGEESRFIVAPPAIKLTSVSTEVMLPDGSIATSWTSIKKSRGMVPGQQ